MPKARRLTDQQKIDAVARVRAGETRCSVARSLGFTEQAITKLVQRRSGKVPCRGKLNDHQKIEIVARYEAGETTMALAQYYGCTFQNISRILRRRGVQMRPCGKPRTDLPLRHALQDVAQLACTL